MLPTLNILFRYNDYKEQTSAVTEGEGGRINDLLTVTVVRS